MFSATCKHVFPRSQAGFWQMCAKIGYIKCGKVPRPLRWRHNGRDSVSNHRCLDRILNCLFRRKSKTPKLRVTGLCEAPPKRAVTLKMFLFDDVIMAPQQGTSMRNVSGLCFYQTGSAWSVDQGTKFGTKFGNCRCKIVDSRAFPSWSLIHGLRWSGLINAEPCHSVIMISVHNDYAIKMAMLTRGDYIRNILYF